MSPIVYEFIKTHSKNRQKMSNEYEVEEWEDADMNSYELLNIVFRREFDNEYSKMSEDEAQYKQSPYRAELSSWVSVWNSFLVTSKNIEI